MNAVAVNFRRKPRGPGASIVAALDIGSYKICCLICAVEPTGSTVDESAPRLRVLGCGYQRSRGIVGGAVVDLRQAQEAVAAAVSQAEQAAGLAVGKVLLAVGCGSPRSRCFNGQVALADAVVGNADIDRLDAGARDFATRNGESLLMLNRLGYALDEVAGITDPRGLAGRRLLASHHAVTANRGPLRNLCLLVESCRLKPEELLPAGYASALAATTEIERRAGVICIDMGAHVTSIAGFVDGHFVFNAAIPVGGQHITDELANSLRLPLEEAERIKTLYANLVTSAFDEHELVSLSGSDDAATWLGSATRAQISSVAEVVLDRLLANATEQLSKCPVSRVSNAEVVITGGAGEISGIADFAATRLARPVRKAGTHRLEGRAMQRAGGIPSSALSGVIGLVVASTSQRSRLGGSTRSAFDNESYLGRVEKWLRHSF